MVFPYKDAKVRISKKKNIYIIFIFKVINYYSFQTSLFKELTLVVLFTFSPSSVFST